MNKFLLEREEDLCSATAPPEPDEGKAVRPRVGRTGDLVRAAIVHRMKLLQEVGPLAKEELDDEAESLLSEIDELRGLALATGAR